MHWSRDLAYAVGLITTDGNLSKDGRHMELTSKDIEQIKNFAEALDLKVKIGTKSSAYNPNGVYYRIQFGNVKLYRFLVKIGLTPNKTKTIGRLKIPDNYFIDFLRGHLDGDGYTSTFWDSMFKNSFRLYTGFTSASKNHLEWIKEQVKRLYDIDGIIECKRKFAFQLKYSKKASIKLLSRLYTGDKILYLERKRSKIMSALDIISRKAGVLER